jgi:hypothetical protein
LLEVESSVAFVLCLLLITTVSGLAQTVDQPARAVTDPGVVTTRQAITPAGAQSIFDGRVHGVAFGRSSSELWVLQRRRNSPECRSSTLIGAGTGFERGSQQKMPGLQGILFDQHSGQLFVAATLTARQRRGKSGFFVFRHQTSASSQN